MTRPARADPVRSPGSPVFAVDLPREGGPVSMTASKALVHGKSIKVFNRRRRGESFVGSWHDRDDYAEWSAVVPRAGGYAVELTYSCDEGAGGKFELVIGDLAIAGRSEQTDEGGSMDSLGAVELPAGQTPVLMRPAGRIEGELMKLRRIHLFPLDAGAFALAKKAEVRRLPPPGSVITLAARAARLPDGPQLGTQPACSTPVQATLAEPIFLPARLAALRGSEIRFEDDDNGDDNDHSIGFWRDPEEHVEWVIHLAHPARYRVLLSYACAAGHGGDVALVGAGESLKGRIKGEGAWDAPPRTLDLGTITLPAGETPLLLKPARPMQDGRALMRCRGLVLLPVGE